MKTPVILALLCACLCGCSRKIYVPVERVSEHTARDTVYVLRQSVDSVVRADSVVTERRGDTVFVQRVSTRYRLRTLTDTLYRTRTDTVLQKERETAAAAPSNNKNSHLVWWLLVVSVVGFAAKRLIARYRKR